jgi:hypothetical protein
LSFIELTLHLNDTLLSCPRIWLCASLMFIPKIKEFVLEINSGSIAAQSALGGHFDFFIINFQVFFLNDSHQHKVTQISYFDSNLWGILAFALWTK